MNPEDVLVRFTLLSEEQNSAFDKLIEAANYVGNSKANREIRVILSNYIVVALTARIEESFRSSLLEYLKIAQSSEYRFSELREALQKSAYRSSIENLRTLQSDRKAAQSELVALSECLEDKVEFRLPQQQLVYNQGNMRSAEVTALCKRFGISDIWHKVSSSKSTLDYFGEDEASRCQSFVIEKWNGIFDERDLVVHQVSAASGWAAEVIIEHVEFCKVIFLEFSRSVSDECKIWLEECAVRRYGDLNISEYPTFGVKIYNALDQVKSKLVYALRRKQK